MKPIAITVPWYGKEIRGGAEQAARYLAHILKDAGADVSASGRNEERSAANSPG